MAQINQKHQQSTQLLPTFIQPAVHTVQYPQVYQGSA